jgi:hypothetical protein
MPAAAPMSALPFLPMHAEKRRFSQAQEFGNGAIEGVAGPEAANNASAAGTLVPLLTLGLPTTATAAIMLAGFQQYGLQPGPLLFVNNPQLVWGLIASLLIANFMLLVLNLPLIGLWVKLLTIPPWLYAGILLFATLGTIGANPSLVELGMLLIFGLMGYGLRRLRLSDRAGGGRADPRADGRAAAASGPRHLAGRCDGAAGLADLGHPARHRRRGPHRAAAAPGMGAWAHSVPGRRRQRLRPMAHARGACLFCVPVGGG